MSVESPPFWSLPPKAPSYHSRRFVTGDEFLVLCEWIKSRGHVLLFEHHGGAYLVLLDASEPCTIGCEPPLPKRKKLL